MAQQITQTQKNIHGTKAVGHKHFSVGNTGCEAVGQNQYFGTIGTGAEKVGDCLEGIPKRHMKQGNQEQQHRGSDGQIAQQKNNVFCFLVGGMGDQFFFRKIAKMLV